jgi:hypothetical protein
MMHAQHSQCSGERWAWPCFWLLVQTFHLEKYEEPLRSQVAARILEGFTFDDEGAGFLGFRR